MAGPLLMAPCTEPPSRVVERYGTNRHGYLLETKEKRASSQEKAPTDNGLLVPPFPERRGGKRDIDRGDDHLNTALSSAAGRGRT